MNESVPLRSTHVDGPDLLPLAPFLAALESDGIRTTLHDHERIHLALRAQGPWTSRRLKSVLAALLVQDPEQDLAFRRRFDQFFELAAENQEKFENIDVERVLDDLRSLRNAREERPPQRPSIGKVGPKPESRPSKLRWSWTLSGIFAGLLLVGILGFVTWGPRDSLPPPPPPPIKDPNGGIDELPLPTLKVHEFQVPVIKNVREDENDRRFDLWKTPAWTGSALLSIIILYYGWLWWMRRPPQDEAPTLDPMRPHLFRAGAIGGAPAPRLDRESLDLMADALGYYRSEEIGRRLDIDRSIAATGKNGGVPRLVFERRRQIRSVLVLEDALAEPLTWNPITAELARGLERRGVPVVHGRFRGVPDRFRTTDGTEVLLEDLEDERRGYLVLVFSDSRGLRRHRDAFVLEALGRWPAVAWMEPREERVWDESTAFVAGFGLPVYPASRAGLLRVLGRFATESSPQDHDAQDRDDWRVRLPQSASRLGEHDLERLLGDTLPWVQACAMMPPPLGLGLADALRRRFHSELPADRIDRLLTLPGASMSGSGLRFSRRLLALLRNGFLARTPDARQVEVLQFLLAQIRAAEPPVSSSVEHQSWEWRFERLRLELDPDRALRRLSALAQGPLGAAIEADLEAARLAPQVDDPAVEVPLRLRPQSRRGLQRLLALARRSGVAPSEAYPLGVRHRVALAGLMVAVLAAGGWMVWELMQRPSTVSLRWEMATDVPGGRLEVAERRATGWENVQTAALDEPKEISLRRGGDYRVRLLGRGQEDSWALGEITRGLVLEVGSESRSEVVGGALEDDLTGMRFVPVSPGTFLMGSPSDEDGRFEDETQHEVTITLGFWIGEAEVTQAQWERVMGSNPARFQACGGECPVELVSWYDAVTFANLLSEQAGLSACYEISGCRGSVGSGCEEGTEFGCGGDYRCDVSFKGFDCEGYRLPTEAEWEYAARAGTETAFYSDDLEAIGWCGGESPRPVRQKAPNAWGLYDVIGNVSEWTWDAYHGDYSPDAAIDPLSGPGIAVRVFRGGSWYGIARRCRAAFRIRFVPEYRGDYVGFRLARTSG